VLSVAVISKTSRYDVVRTNAACADNTCYSGKSKIGVPRCEATASGSDQGGKAPNQLRRAVNQQILVHVRGLRCNEFQSSFH
jgi:hypothetical protein